MKMYVLRKILGKALTGASVVAKVIEVMWFTVLAFKSVGNRIRQQMEVIDKMQNKK